MEICYTIVSQVDLTYSLSVGVAYEIGSVSLGIPLGKASVYSKSYETVRIKPTLIKQ